MTNEPFHPPLNWDHVQQESMISSRRQRRIDEARSASERARVEGTGFWWDAQKYIDQVVPAEYVNPANFDTFNYRYQVYARAAPIPCPPRCLSEVSEERPPIMYNVRRIAMEKPFLSEPSECDGRPWCKHPCGVAVRQACNSEKRDTSRNNNTTRKKSTHSFRLNPLISRPNCDLEDVSHTLNPPFIHKNLDGNLHPCSDKSNIEWKAGNNTNVTAHTSALPTVTGAKRIMSGEKSAIQCTSNDINASNATSDGPHHQSGRKTAMEPKNRDTIYNSCLNGAVVIHNDDDLLKVAKKHQQGKSSNVLLSTPGQKRRVPAPLATKDNVSCLLTDHFNKNKNNANVDVLDRPKLDKFQDMYIIDNHSGKCIRTTTVHMTDQLDVQGNQEESMNENPTVGLLYFDHKVNVNFSNNNSAERSNETKARENVRQLICEPFHGRDEHDPCKSSKKLICRPSRPSANLPVTKRMPCTRHFSQRELLHRNENRPAPVSLGHVACEVSSEQGYQHGEPVVICEPDLDRKTPEIGYDTYKIVASRVFRPQPPTDHYKDIKLEPHLEEYREFTRRCPNFQVGRYDRGDPLNEMLLPAHKDSRCLRGSLSPFVYARNTKAGNLPPLFHTEKEQTGDLCWRLPSFLKI